MRRHYGVIGFAALVIAASAGCGGASGSTSRDGSTDGTMLSPDAGEAAGADAGPSDAGGDAAPGDGGEPGADAGPTVVDRVYEVEARSPAVDLLLVLDNSGSMGAKQAALANSFVALTDTFDSNRVSYRIGLTTTDNGNPWCPVSQTTPENGGLVLSSCTTRLGDFVFNGTDLQDVACNDVCGLDAAELAISPLAPDTDPRRWVQHGPEGQNLPAGTTVAGAMRCFLPQGVNGCGFESPLQSMRRALQRSSDVADPAYGFLRDDASLLVLFFTDEADCSSAPEWAEIFAPDGNRVFWSSPLSSFPTSAVCWNAGVRCSGTPSPYTSCASADLDKNGNVTTSAAAAVLYPVAEYVDLLRSLEAEKQQTEPGARVLVGLIVGVQDDGSPFYADVGATDPAFQDAYGIGPGCTAPGGITAVPPVRLLEVAEAFSAGTPGSICGSEHSAALARFAARAAAAPQRFCFDGCAADVQPETAGLVADCSVIEILASSEQRPVPPCPRDGGGAYLIDPSTGTYAMPDASVDACYALLVDQGAATADPADDISPRCLEAGTNVEVAIARRSGVPAQPGARLSVSCRAPSPQPDVCAGTGS